MGIFCEICVNKTPDGEFRPGDRIAGAIKYAVDTETTFSNITVSLKGIGRLNITDHRFKDPHHYFKKETYVDVDLPAYNEKEKEEAVGMKEVQFEFELPNKIPPSFVYKGFTDGRNVSCKIQYYIRIKFERKGFTEFNKRFKKEITVRPGLTPTLSPDPLMKSEQFKLVTIGTDNIIDLKACIQNPVINRNGKVKFSYELFNNTSVKLEGVKVKVKGVYVFKINSKKKFSLNIKTKKYLDVDGTSSKSGQIPPGETQTMEFEIDLPADAYNIMNSELVSREYFVNVKVLLPMFRVNREMKVPFQVGDLFEVGEEAAGFESPPSYWEAMSECEKGSID